MGGSSAGLAMRALAAIVCVIAMAWLALWYFIPAPPHELTIAAGIKGGAFEHIANRYKTRLARHHVKLNMRFASAGETFKLVQDSKSGVSTGFLFSGLLHSETAPTSSRLAASMPHRSGSSTAVRRRSSVCRSSRASALMSPSQPAISLTRSSPPMESGPAT